MPSTVTHRDWVGRFPIPKADKPAIMEELAAKGITESLVYPER